jgi:nucleoid-associated protein YgaU
MPPVPFQADVLAVGANALRYTRPTPVATRTIEIHDAPPTFTPAPPTSHVVEPGETLIAIARNELGDASRWRDIVAVNPGLNPSEIKAGQRLKLPN